MTTAQISALVKPKRPRGRPGHKTLEERELESAEIQEKFERTKDITSNSATLAKKVFLKAMKDYLKKDSDPRLAATAFACAKEVYERIEPKKSVHLNITSSITPVDLKEFLTRPEKIELKQVEITQ